MPDLKKQAEELGIDVDGRWSDETLQEKIDEAKAQQSVKVDVDKSKLSGDSTLISKDKPVEVDTTEEIAETAAIEPKKVSKPAREKTLHELNLEAREHDRAMRDMNTEAAKAAQKAVEDTLGARRSSNRRMQKNLRAPVE